MLGIGKTWEIRWVKILLVSPKCEKVIVLSNYLSFQYCDNNIGFFSTIKLSLLIFFTLFFVKFLCFFPTFLFLYSCRSLTLLKAIVITFPSFVRQKVGRTITIQEAIEKSQILLPQYWRKEQTVHQKLFCIFRASLIFWLTIVSSCLSLRLIKA